MLEVVKEKLAERVFNHLKDDGDTKQVFENNHPSLFIDCISCQVFGQDVLPYTNTYKDGLTVGQMNDEHRLEMQVIDLLDGDRVFRDGFGKLVAQKLIAQFN